MTKNHCNTLLKKLDFPNFTKYSLSGNIYLADKPVIRRTETPAIVTAPQNRQQAGQAGKQRRFGIYKQEKSKTRQKKLVTEKI
jgi:hypothetical protein